MKRILLLILFAGIVLAQNTLDPNNTSTSASGSISVNGTDCTNSNACVWIVAPSNGTSAAIQLSGTFTATLQFEKSVAGSVWVSATSTNNATSATSAGIYSFTVVGARFLRVRASAYSAGPVVVNITATVSGGSGGGSGSGASLPATTNLIKGDGLGNGADSGISVDGSGNVAISASCPGGDTSDVCIGGYFVGDGSKLTGVGTGTGYVGPVTKVTDSAYGVATSKTAAQNQTAFAAVATAVNAGTASPYVYIPAGAYNVLTTGSSGLGTYNSGVTIHCENPLTTTLTFSGTGYLVQFGAAGLAPMGSTPFTWNDMRLENCGITGGASMTAGVYVAPENWGTEVRDNYIHDFGSASNRLLYGDCDTWIRFHDNRYLRDDLVAGNVGGVICGTTTTWSLLEAWNNSIVSTNSTSDPNSHVMGTGFESDGHAIVHDNKNMSGPVPLFRCGTHASGTSATCSFTNNLVEMFGSPGVMFGTVGGSTETTNNLIVSDNQVYSNGAYNFIGPANSASLLTNAVVVGNRLRDGSNGGTAMLNLNNLTGQTGNVAQSNRGWTVLNTPQSNVPTLGAFNTQGTYTTGYVSSSDGAPSLNISAGCHSNNGSAWIADAATCTILNFNTSSRAYQVFFNSGLTIGSTFTPAVVDYVGQDGSIAPGNVTSSGWGEFGSFTGLNAGNVGDIGVSRSGNTTGVVYFGSTSHSILWNSSGFTLSNNLIVNAGGSANKATCWKSDAKSIGFCSTQPDSTGACTCN